MTASLPVSPARNDGGGRRLGGGGRIGTEFGTARAGPTEHTH